MPDEPCRIEDAPPYRWWESSAIRSGLVSVICGILLAGGYAADADFKTWLNELLLIVVPAIAAIVTGVIQIRERLANNRCKRDITAKLL